MCLAIPLKVKRITKEKAISEDDKEIDISLITEDLKKGDYLLVHDDLAINKLAKEEAEKIIKTVKVCKHNH